MKKDQQYKIPTFNFSRKKYQCYIHYGAFDHKKGVYFTDKIRKISPYCKFQGFDKLREHFNDKKLEIVQYVHQHIIPKVSEALLSGQLDRGIENQHWTKINQRRKSAEFIPIKNLIEEFIQSKYLTNESISTKDLYRDSLTAFKDSLSVVIGKNEFNQITIKDITELHVNQVFMNWAQFKYDNSNTRRIYRDKVKMFFESYIEIIKVNPVNKKTRIKAQGKGRNISLLSEDKNKIFTHLQSKTNRKYKELFGFSLLMYYGLMRGDTIYQLTCGHFKKGKDNLTYFIEIPANMVKNKQPGNIIIPIEVIKYLIDNGIYDPHQPDKLLFPPLLKEKPSRETTKNNQRKSGHLRNRMWASNLYRDILTNELKYSKAFASRHNIYCLKATGALYLLNDEKWDIREISAQMLHKQLSTTFIYIQNLRLQNSDPTKRKFTQCILEKNQENVANDVNSPQSTYTQREQTVSKINDLNSISMTSSTIQCQMP